MTELFRALCQRYKGTIPADYGRMTPYQVRHIFLESAESPPDEVDADEWVKARAKEKQTFLAKLAAKGVSETDARARWADHLAGKFLAKPPSLLPDISSAAMD